MTRIRDFIGQQGTSFPPTQVAPSFNRMMVVRGKETFSVPFVAKERFFFLPIRPQWRRKVDEEEDVPNIS